MAPLFVALLCLFTLTHCTYVEDFDGTGLSINSTWNDTYSKLGPSSISSIAVYTTEAGAQGDLLDTSDIANNLTYSSVYNRNSTTFEGGFLLSGLPNSAGNTAADLKECFGVTNGGFGVGLWFEFNLTDTFEIYRVQIFFGTDYGENYNITETVEVGSPDLPAGYSSEYISPRMFDMKTAQEVTPFTNAFGWYTSILTPSPPFDWSAPRYDWTAWQNDDIPTKEATPLTDRVVVKIGNKGDSPDISFRVCEIQIYGRYVTQAPTSQPTQVPVAPTFQPTTFQPTFQPTAAPSANPSAAPSAAPTGAPTEDACPDFDVTQPCCATDGGYAWVDYAYSKLNGSLIGRAEESASQCVMTISDTACCASDLNVNTYDLFWFPNQNPTRIECFIVDGTEPVGDSSDADLPVCGIDLFTGVPSSTYEGLSGYGNLSALDFTAKQCACDYTLDICETRRELTCDGSDTPYAADTELCGVSHFIGGDANGTTMVSDSGPDIDNGTETCDCGYVADHCADDADYRDYFKAPGMVDDGDNNTVNFIQDCCIDSELVFGGEALDNLTLKTYLTKSVDGVSEWGCADEQALCDGSNVPDNDLVEKEQWLAWVLNNGSFNTSTSCECWIKYDELATPLPTQVTTAPSVDPTMTPSSSPTPAPTVYNYNDFVDAVVTQPCQDNAVPCDASYFEGSSERVSFVNETVFNSGSCACVYSVGRWEWTISSDPGYLDLTDDVWTLIRPNITWSDANETALVEGIATSSGLRRLLDSTTTLSCYDMFVTECENVGECVDNAPFASEVSYLLSAVGTTNASWNEYVSNVGVEEVTVCHCYFLYSDCLTASPTIDPTAQPTTRDPTLSPTKDLSNITTTAEKDLGEQAQALVEDNLLYSIAAGAGLLMFLFCCCLLCLKKRQINKRKAAVENKDHISYSPASTQENGNDNDTKNMTPVHTDGGGLTEMTKAASSSATPVIPEYRDNGDGTYAITFSERPFGLQFKASKPDKKNLIISGVKAGSVASRVAEFVVMGSTMVRIMDTEVENKGTRVINKVFGGEFGQRLPLTITFRRPVEAVAVEEEEKDEMEELVQAMQAVSTQEVMVTAVAPAAMAAAEAEQEEVLVVAEAEVYVEAEDEYTVLLEERPFGISFGKKSDDKRNLYVNGLDEGGVGETAGVVMDSRIVRIMNDEARDLGAKKIFKLITKKYADTLPLSITFQRPAEVEQEAEAEEEYVEEKVEVPETVGRDAVAAAVAEDEAEYEEEEVEAEAQEEAVAEEAVVEEEQYEEEEQLAEEGGNDEDYEYYEEE